MTNFWRIIEVTVGVTFILSLFYPTYFKPNTRNLLPVADLLQVFYAFCHGGVENGYPRGIVLESATETDFLIEPSDIQSLMTGNPYLHKQRRRLIFFNSCNLASDFAQNYQIMSDYMLQLEAFGSGTWNHGAMAGYANQVSNSVARGFATNFFTRLVNNPSNSMSNSFDWAMNQTSRISQAQPVLRGSINTAFEDSNLKF